MKPLLLGEQPSRSGDRYSAFPLSGMVGRRLCRWAGILPISRPDQGTPTYGDYYWALRDHFDCVNAREHHTERWRQGEARSRVREYLKENPTDRVVALGVRAFAAVADQMAPWGEWTGAWAPEPMIREMRVVMIPHPSTRNLLYNDPKMVELAQRVLREALEK